MLTSIQFASSSVQSGSTTRLDGAWSLPNNPATPAGFAIDLPAGLQGLTDAFPLLAPNGDEMGACTVTNDQLYCDISTAYIAANPLNLSGTFNFWVTVNTQVTESTVVTYDFGGITDSITVTAGAGECTDCVFDGQWNDKYGFYDRDDDSIWWIIDIESPAAGMIGGETISVLELLGPNQALQTAGGVPNINVIGTNQLDSDGYPDYNLAVDVEFDLTETPEGWVVTFVTDAGWFYSLDVFVDVTNAGAPGAGTYTNEARITIESGQSEVVGGQVVRQGGGGTGSGEGFGNFTITKVVNWAGQPVEGIVFTGTYTVAAPDGSLLVEDAPFSLAAGETWTSDGYVVGSTVHLVENLPTEPANLIWAAPEFSVNDFIIGNQTTTGVTLTNEAIVNTGVFEASKVLAGDASGLVADDVVFFLDYSYPAGEGFDGGSGTVELPANGDVVTSGALPVGAVLTLTERAPDAISGATWSEPVLSSGSVTIGDGEAVSVTVTNTLTRNTGVPGGAVDRPDATESVDGTGSEPSTGLAVTGGQLSIVAVLIGVALTLTGAGVLVSRRSATSRS